MVTRCNSLQVPNKRLINIQTLVRNYKPLNFFFSLVLTSNNPPLKIHCENIIVAFLNFNFLFFIILFFFTKTHQKIKLLEFIHSHSRTYHFFFFSFFFFSFSTFLHTFSHSAHTHALLHLDLHR